MSDCDLVKVKRALISVSDKSGIGELANALSEMGVNCAAWAEWTGWRRPAQAHHASASQAQTWHIGACGSIGCHSSNTRVSKPPLPRRHRWRL